MKFSEIEYKRPDFDALYDEFDSLLEEFSAAKSVDEQFELYCKIDELTDDYDTQHAITRIRNFIDTNDEFYAEEHKVFSRNNPTIGSKYNKLNELVLSSRFKKELGEKIGYVTMLNIELSAKSFSSEIMDDKREESRLIFEYLNIMSKLSVEFDGKTMPLSMLAPYKESPRRDVRKKAFIAEGECYNSVKDELDRIFDDLVKNRTAQARKLGFENFIELGYARMRRNCYNRSDVAVFKQEVVKDVLPLAKEIYAQREERLGFCDLKIYDEMIAFREGSPCPKISEDEMVEAGKKMYAAMSPELAEFAELMIENELYDLRSKIGKSPGGFCSYLKKYDYPFIFANFNGTSADVGVFTHEAGHAFAKYISSKSDKRQFSLYSMDISETHSMTMEFLTTPWYDLFFQEDAERYKLQHAENSVLFIPYACQVDEFQERVYLNPDLTPKQRDELWLEIEGRFRPNMSHEEIPFYNTGAAWKKQTHIFKSPFYYIDYALAQIMALQFFALFLESQENVMKLYMELVGYGSSLTFVDLIKKIGLKSPLETENIKPIISTLKKWINHSNVT